MINLLSNAVIFTRPKATAVIELESYNLGANSYLVKLVEFDKFHGMICQVASYWLFLNNRP